MAEYGNSRFKGWQRVLLIIIPFVIVLMLFQLLGLLLAGIAPEDASANLSTLQNIILTACSLAGTVLLVWVFRKYIDRESFTDIGLYTSKRGFDIILGILTGLILVGLGFVILLGLKSIEIRKVEYDVPEILWNIVLFVLVSFNEEILMRGYVLNNLMLSMNKYVALLVSSIAFAALHLANPHFSLITFVTILLSGLLLGISYIFTRNLWFPIALHFSWNFFQGPVFGFNVSGHDSYSLIGQYRPKDDLLNGGLFGFEGSLLAVGFLLLATGIIWKIYHYSYKKSLPSI